MNQCTSTLYGNVHFYQLTTKHKPLAHDIALHVSATHKLIVNYGMLPSYNEFTGSEKGV